MTIEAKNLLKIYGKRKVVNDVDINVERGEVVGLLGPNGAGKTTTFYMVVGMIKPNKGSIFLDGKNISKSPMYKRSRLGLGYLPQEASVFRKLSVEENILAIWQLRGGAPNLNVKEKIELAIRKGERSWWRRSRYEDFYKYFLNDLKAPVEYHNEVEAIGHVNLPGKEVPKFPQDKLFFISKFMELLEIDFPSNKETALSFLSEFGKFYKLGKKKKFDEFLTSLWKIKRDEIFDKLKTVDSKSERTNLITSVIKYMDIDHPVINKISEEDVPDFDNSNQLIDYLNTMDSIYWTQRKLIFSQKADELKRIDLLKRDKLKNETTALLKESDFKDSEIKDVIDSLDWSKKQSQHFQLEDILDEFNITHIRNSRGSDLSGGERRRVEIARAVANKPSFLLLDEPFAGIDPIAVSGIKDMIVLLKNRNIGVLITDHNVRETLKIIDRGYILSDGKIIAQGTKEQLAGSEIARKHYLGEDFSM